MMKIINEPSAEAKAILADPRHREPRGAYVLFESLKREVQDDGSVKTVTRLMPFMAESRPGGIRSKIKYYIRKGARLIGYGNIPSANDSDPARQFQYGLFKGPGGQPNEYDLLKAEIEATANQAPRDWQQQRDALEAKLAAYQEKEKGALTADGKVRNKDSSSK